MVNLQKQIGTKEISKWDQAYKSLGYRQEGWSRLSQWLETRQDRRGNNERRARQQNKTGNGEDWTENTCQMVPVFLLLMMGAKCKIDRVERGLSHGLTCDRVAYLWLSTSKLRHSFFWIVTLWATSLWRKRHNAYVREVLQAFTSAEFQAHFLGRVPNTSPHNFCNFVASLSCLRWTWVQGELRNNTLSYIKDGCVCRYIQPQCLYFLEEECGWQWATPSRWSRRSVFGNMPAFMWDTKVCTSASTFTFCDISSIFHWYRWHFLCTNWKRG